MFADARDSCREVLSSEYRAYTSKLRVQLAALPRGSKRWWSLNRELLNKRASRLTMPPLKDTKGRWVDAGNEKADLLADAFADKCAPLPTYQGAFPEGAFHSRMSEFVLVRKRSVF